MADAVRSAPLDRLAAARQDRPHLGRCPACAGSERGPAPHRTKADARSHTASPALDQFTHLFPALGQGARSNADYDCKIVLDLTARIRCDNPATGIPVTWHIDDVGELHANGELDSG